MKKYFLKFFVVFLTLVSLPFNATAQQGDIMTTFAGAQFIAGINWGLVTATDHSITISNAHLIPMNPSGGPVTFTVEWGKGSPGQNSNNYEFLGTTQPATLSYSGGDTNYDVNLPGEDNDYYFSITLNNLEPTTNYYFTIHEVNPYEAQPGVTDYGYNLFTYGFATTDEIPNLGGNSSTTPPGGGPNFSNATTTGLIPCGSVGQPDCDFDQFIVLINNVVDFLIVFIAFPFVAIVVAWAGILLLTSGGNSSAKEKSKKMIWHVVIGLILALLSWGIIKIILMTLGYQGPLLGIFGIN